MRRGLWLLIFLIRCSETGLNEKYEDVNGIYLEKVGKYYEFNEAEDIAGRDGYIYVADGKGGILILNLKNPSKPTIVDTLNPEEGYTVLVAKKGYLYALSYPYLEVFDISNPSNPVEIGKCKARGWNFVIKGHYLYMIGGDLEVINIGNPFEPEIIGEQDISGSDITVEGNYAYILEQDGWGSKLHIVDLSTPSFPQPCLTYSALKDAPPHLCLYTIKSKGNYLMGVASTPKVDGVELLDITDPWDIKYLDFCSLPQGEYKSPKTFLVDSIFIYTLGHPLEGNGYNLFLLSFSPDSTELAVSEMYEEKDSPMRDYRSIFVEGSRIYILGSNGVEIIEMKPIQE